MSFRSGCSGGSHAQECQSEWCECAGLHGSLERWGEQEGADSIPSSQEESSGIVSTQQNDKSPVCARKNVAHK